MFPHSAAEGHDFSPADELLNTLIVLIIIIIFIPLLLILIIIHLIILITMEKNRADAWVGISLATHPTLLMDRAPFLFLAISILISIITIAM